MSNEARLAAMVQELQAQRAALGDRAAELAGIIALQRAQIAALTKRVAELAPKPDKQPSP